MLLLLKEWYPFLIKDILNCCCCYCCGCYYHGCWFGSLITNVRHTHNALGQVRVLRLGDFRPQWVSIYLSLYSLSLPLPALPPSTSSPSPLHPPYPSLSLYFLLYPLPLTPPSLYCLSPSTLSTPPLLLPLSLYSLSLNPSLPPSPPLACTS